MPSQELSHRFQRALLWAATGRFTDGGEAEIGEPVEVVVRWVNKRSQVIGTQGQPLALDATAMLARAVPIGSRMWCAPNAGYSALDQFLGSGSYGDDTDIMEVVTYGETPDIRNRARTYEVGLRRYRDVSAAQ